MKKLLVIFLVTGLLAGVGYYMFKSGAGLAQNGMPGGMPPAAVKTQTLEIQPITLYESLPGRTSAFKVAQIRPQVNGIITERKFDEGSLVKEGDQLYQIDPAPYRAAYNRALADLQKARANAKAIEAKEKRYQELVKINAVSLQEYDDIKASYDQAKADIAVANAMVAAAKVDLDYTKVYAPISGRIGASSVTEGALVTAGQGQPLATITQLDPIYVDMSQSVGDMMRLRGQIDPDKKNLVELVLEDNSQLYDQMGTLQFSDVSVDETTGSVQLRALFPNPDERLLPGLFVRARIHLGTQDVLLVPQRATTRTPDGNLMVWTVTPDNTARPAPIEVARGYNDQWIVTGGVKAGDVIIVEGYQKVGPGAPVAPEGEGQAPDGLIPAEPPPGAPQEDAPVDPGDMSSVTQPEEDVIPEQAPPTPDPPVMDDALSAQDLLNAPTETETPAE